MKIILKLKFVSFLLIIPLLGTISCKKASETSDACAAFKNYVPPGGWTLQNTYKAFGWPDFNPNNNNEIVYEEYSRADTASPEHRLCTYNLITHQKKLLVTGVFLYQPKWGSKDWIAFTNYPDYQLWIIKSDGTKLTCITNGGNGSEFLFPEWSPDGSKIILRGGKPINVRNMIIDTTGAILKDSLIISYPFSWSSDGIHISGAIPGNWGILDLNTNIVATIPTLPQCFFPDGNSWLTQSMDGLYVYHTNAKQSQKIKNNCGPVYSFFSISNDGTKIICARDISHVVDSQTILNENAIVIINADGSNEHVVDIK